MIERLQTKLYALLRWSEKYTKTDMVYLTRGGFWLGLSQAIQIVSGLVLTIAFVNLLPKEVYGTYQFILSVAAILGTFTLSNIDTAITRAVAKGNEGALRYGFNVRLKWSTWVVLASGALALYYFLNEQNVLGFSFLIVGSFSPLLAGFQLTSSYLIGKHLFRENTLLGSWRKALPIFSLFIALFLTKNPALLILVYFISHTISAGLIYILVIRRYHLPCTEEPALVSLSKHLSFLSLLGMIGKNLDKLLIFHFLGAAPVAAYSLAQLPILHMQGAFALARQLTLPKLSQRSFTELQKTLPRKVNLSFCITLLLIFLYIFLAPYLFKVVFPSYPEAIMLTQIMALGILSLPRGFYMQAFSAHEMKREMYITQLSMPLMNIAGLAILLPLYGIWGAVFASLLAHVCTSIVAAILFSRKKEVASSGTPLS